MTRKEKDRQFHIISSGQQSWETFCSITAHVHEEVDAIHLREKKWSASELISAISLLSEQGVPLRKIIVNERIDVAHMMRTKGVQLAYHAAPPSMVRRTFPNLQIGCSVHSLAHAVQAETMGADWLLYGHVFPTDSKPGIPARGLSLLCDMVEHVSIPVIALGGVTPENTEEVMATGVAGIAVLSGVFLAQDPLIAAKEYRNKLMI